MAQSILLAEDEETIRLLVRRTLEQAGYSVCEAADGREAIRALSCVPFDLLITDIVMPGADGIETILHARKLMPRIQIIAISGCGSRELFLDDASSLGATRTISKPFRPTELLQVVKELLGPATPTPHPARSG
jgi:two-component system cell cycle response regulator CpdR